ncbi:MAG: TIGR04255 family protein [Candidatus Thiodiazotropha sp.]|nr:TIGR04255 family protein [Candidatus Thiodiazotropha sp. (ex Lucina pensylvanica)]
MTGEIKPFGERHAIKSMAFAIEFSTELKPDVFSQIIGLHHKIQNDLPRIVPKQTLLVDLDPVIQPSRQEQPAAPSRKELGGVMFDSLNRDGTQQWALKVTPAFISVSFQEYTRWVEIWQKAQEFLAIVAPVCLNNNDILALGLQYIDEFHWYGTKSEFTASKLFDDQSDYLAPNAFNLDDLWHCHHGYFAYLSTPNKHKQLNTINVDILDENEVRLARILTTHRSIPSQPITDMDHLFENNAIDEYMDLMHVENKNILKNLLIKDMQTRISLK